MTTARFTIACVANAILLIVQAVLLVALANGAAKQFEIIYQSFGMPKTSFGFFFLANYKLWWGVLAVCLVLAGTGAWRRSARVLWLSLALSMLTAGSIFATLYIGILTLTRPV